MGVSPFPEFDVKRTILGKTVFIAVKGYVRIKIIFEQQHISDIKPLVSVHISVNGIRMAFLPCIITVVTVTVLNSGGVMIQYLKIRHIDFAVTVEILGSITDRNRLCRGCHGRGSGRRCRGREIRYSIAACNELFPKQRSILLTDLSVIIEIIKNACRNKIIRLSIFFQA